MLGAICGDILGSPYELNGEKYDDPEQIDLFRSDDTITDDTVLTLAVADWLLHDQVEMLTQVQAKGKLAQRFLEYVRVRYGNRKIGYGFQFWHWIARCELLGEYAPYGSYGNGSAMRVSPVAWFFRSLEDVRYYAHLQADVTHNHPEGERGAEAIASAIFLARNAASKQEIQKYITHEFNYDLSVSVAQLRSTCKFDVTCQGSVPHAVLAFLESDDYESAIRLAISYGGDSDTIACMAGSIAEAYYHEIPSSILAHCLPLLDEHAESLCRTIRGQA